MDTKTCTKCNTERSVLDFNKNKRKKDGLQGYCRDCTKEINKDTYARLPQRREKIRERNTEHRLHTQRLVTRYKRMCKCAICKESEPIALDLHHVDPTEKDAEVGKLLTGSMRRLRNEIRKCVVLCANCHRKVHAGLLEINRA